MNKKYKIVTMLFFHNLITFNESKGMLVAIGTLENAIKMHYSGYILEI